ncbi:uncharacterized protein [Garra rufa]|uniref:uncharacterized protein n=1 Tax=Garra rufa TaxID=137080 RepID=UPI003CCEDAE1
MLGVQETRSTGSPKTYSCVACSATFHSLSSLLVHQASHASEMSHQQESALPTCVSCGSLFASKDLLEKHHCIMMPTPASPAHTYTSDCGEEFSACTDLEERKKQCVSEIEVKTDLEIIPVVPHSKTEPSRLISDQVFHSVLPSHSNEKPLAQSPPPSSITNIKENESTEGSILKPTESHPVTEEQEQQQEEQQEQEHQHQQEHQQEQQQQQQQEQQQQQQQQQQQEQQQEPEQEQQQEPEQEQEQEQKQLPENDNDCLKSANVLNHFVDDNEKSQASCEDSAAINKTSILKIVASAYMGQKQPVQMKQRNLPPRKASPRAPLQPPIILTISKPKPPENQSKIKKDTVVGVKTGKMLPKKGKIISVTQTLCPVVVLETRQKLFGRDNIEGRHQCRLCRRVFQDVDSLIMHHALHKKERVKFCLCCQQFVITVISVPESHVCSDGSSRNHQPLMGKMSLKPVSPTAEKMFYCSLCKRGYTRMRSLKKHNCPCKASLKSSATVGTSSYVNPENLEECNRAVPNSKTNQMPTQHVNVGVGTEPIKIEEQNTELPIGKKVQLGLKMQPKHPLNTPKNPESIFVSVSNTNPTVPTKNSANMVEVKQEERDKLVEKQWTMPLDDAEIDVLIDVDQKDSDEDDLSDLAEDDYDEGEDVAIVEPPEDKEMKSPVPSNGFQVHVTNKGLKRFVCNGCQRSYSRLFTLKEHLKMCGARELKPQNVTSHMDGPIKKFPCPQCGKFFSRKDNMNLHRRKCHPINTNSVVSNRTVEPKTPASQENLFVLSPSTENQAVRQEGAQNTSRNTNWGIMSLPSVLPRRVTCECGASFTCPRLLFEHLQQHAQESYICPHCGENLQSWMDFEAHQQLHNQPQSSASELRASQQQPHSFSQAASTRPQQSPTQPPALLAPQHLNNKPFPDELTCHKCKKSFSLRKNLLRHLRLRCIGDDAGQNKHTCSRCGTTFQNPLMLKVHIQSNTCKPALKPFRCPVCVRWFSCLDGLKRHLVSHSRQSVFTCQICDQNYQTPQALEEHKRNDHRVNRPVEDAQKQLNQAGAQTSSSNPFQCHICLRNYPKLQSLKDHLRKVHRPKPPKPTNVRTVEPVRSGPFQCQICERFYPNIKSLKNHRRRVHHIVGGVFLPSKGTEQNITPSQFQCQICSHSFPDEQSLRNHRRRAHLIVRGHGLSSGMAQHNLYKCQICQRSYPDAVSLKNHRRRVHRILGPVPETTPPPPPPPLLPTNHDIEDPPEEKPIPFL